MYIRKTIDIWEIQSLNDGEWGTECTEYSHHDAIEQLKCYRENLRQPVRIHKSREKKEPQHDSN